MMVTVHCDYCKSDKNRVVLKTHDHLLNNSKDNFNLVKCLQCGLVFINPRPTEDEIPNYYPTWYVKDFLPQSYKYKALRYKGVSGVLKNNIRCYFWGYPNPYGNSIKSVSHRLLSMLTYCLKYIPFIVPYKPKQVLLDIGCGGGAFLKELKDLCPEWELWGLEPSKDISNELKSAVNTILNMTLEEVKLPDDYFDVVTATDVIEHLISPSAGLKKIHQTLKPGGIFICSTPNYQSLEIRLFGKDAFSIDAPRHLFHFTKKTMKAILEQAGFTSIKVIKRKGGTKLHDSYIRHCTAQNKKPGLVLGAIFKLIDKSMFDTSLRAYATK